MKCAVKLAQQHPVRTTVKIITYCNQQRAILHQLLEGRRAKITVKSDSPLNCVDVCSIDACQCCVHTARTIAIHYTALPYTALHYTTLQQ
eukprot:11031-Heterococcus_DN1.PRE.1